MEEQAKAGNIVLEGLKIPSPEQIGKNEGEIFLTIEGKEVQIGNIEGKEAEMLLSAQECVAADLTESQAWYYWQRLDQIISAIQNAGYEVKELDAKASYEDFDEFQDDFRGEGYEE